MTHLMRKHSSFSLTWLSVGDVDGEDRCYAVTPAWFASPELKQSVQRVGLITPLWLERRGNSRLRLISGFRRFTVARELEIAEIPCFVTAVESPIETFISALWENIGCRPFTELEKAIALEKLKCQFGLPEAQLIKDFLPAFELHADFFHLERYLKIARLPASLQKAITEAGLHTDLALGLSAWKEEEQTLFIGLVSRYQLGRNKQKELFELLRDLRAIREIETPSIWEESGAREIDEDPQLSPQDRLVRIRAVLRGLRYPRLNLYEKRYRELRRALQLPPGVRLQVPPYFEGSRVSITIDAGSAGELRDLMHLGQHLLDRKELDQIFELL